MKKLNINGRTLNIIITLAVAAILISFLVIDELEINSRQSFLKNMSTATNLQKELGFDASIHNFKNYILRGEQKYYRRAKRHFQKTLTLLDTIEADSPVRENLSDVAAIRRNVRDYLIMLDVAKTQVTQNNTTGSELDKFVYVDDNAAADAVNRIIARITKKWEDKTTRGITNRRIVTFILLLVLGLRSIQLSRYISGGIKED